MDSLATEPGAWCALCIVKGAQPALAVLWRDVTEAQKAALPGQRKEEERDQLWVRPAQPGLWPECHELFSRWQCAS